MEVKPSILAVFSLTGVRRFQLVDVFETPAEREVAAIGLMKRVAISSLGQESCSSAQS